MGSFFSILTVDFLSKLTFYAVIITTDCKFTKYFQKSLSRMEAINKVMPKAKEYAWKGFVVGSVGALVYLVVSFFSFWSFMTS